MPEPFRVIDTGIRDGREQIAFDQAMIELHKAGEIPDTIRFLQFPKTALIGRHQALSKELKLDYCAAHDIRTVRRITGGGALYFDEGQLGWELIFHRDTLGISSLGDLARAICEAAAHGISKLGVDAHFRPRNDIEIDGRKVSGTGGYFDGDTLFYQGTLLVDMDPATMIKAINIPASRLAKNGAESGAQRVVTLKELLNGAPPMDEVKAALIEGFAEKLGVTPARGEITDREEALTRELFESEIGTDAFVAEIDDPDAPADVRAASNQTPGGLVNAYVRLEGPTDGLIREVLITGDFFATPPRVIMDLEAHLRGKRTDAVEHEVKAFFEAADVGLLTVTPDHFADVIKAAIAS